MSNQHISLRAKLTQNPIFIETKEGAKFAEITLMHEYSFSDRNGSEIQLKNPFNVIVKEDLIPNVKTLNSDEFVLVKGIYRQVKKEAKVEHLIFAEEISRSKDKKLKDINVAVTGNLTSEPEIKDSAKGNKYFRLAVATNTKYKNTELEEVEDTTFYNLLFVGEVAEVNQELKKGEYVTIKGSLELKPYKAKDGSSKLDSLIFVKDIQTAKYNPENEIQPDEVKHNTN